MLDVECSVRGSSETYLAKVRAQHRQNPRLFEPRPLEARSFGIQHFAGRVVYDASDFLGEHHQPPCWPHHLSLLLKVASSAIGLNKMKPW